jgi:hypothetical protein
MSDQMNLSRPRIGSTIVVKVKDGEKLRYVRYEVFSYKEEAPEHVFARSSENGMVEKVHHNHVLGMGNYVKHFKDSLTRCGLDGQSAEEWAVAKAAMERGFRIPHTGHFPPLFGSRGAKEPPSDNFYNTQLGEPHSAEKLMAVKADIEQSFGKDTATSNRLFRGLDDLAQDQQQDLLAQPDAATASAHGRTIARMQSLINNAVQRNMTLSLENRRLERILKNIRQAVDKF